ncbi:hypothetical protein [Paenibacillus xylanexedens]|uniref:hypothetical protein n=1 Tax=Paenibacillus xylanexedens TaxID=528191 RepID=UPI003B01B2FF
MRKVLSLAQPIMESYLHHAYQTSIIGNEEKSMPWVLSNYIQLYFDGNDALPVQFYMPDETGYTWNVACPFLDVQLIKKETITGLHLDIIECIIYALNNESYVITYINENHVPQKPSYQNRDFSHMFFIYGYDQEKKVFHHLGYNMENNNRKFGTIEVAFQDFVDAYYNNPEYLFHSHDKLFMAKPNCNFQYDFNVERVLDQLQQLLHSNRQQQFNDDPNHVFGLDVYGNFRRIIQQSLENGNELKIPPFLLLAEHKKIMQLRLEYMNRLKQFESFQKEQNRYRQLEQRLIFLRNAALLYNRTKRSEAMESMMDEIMDIRAEEADILDTIIHRMNLG